jgi:hypothetical protein
LANTIVSVGDWLFLNGVFFYMQIAIVFLDDKSL